MKKAYIAIIAFACAPLTGIAQVKISETVKLGSAPSITQPDNFYRYITRGNFCSVVLERLVFTESIPGKMMLDISMRFVDGEGKEKGSLRFIPEQLVQIGELGMPLSVERSGQYIAQNISLANVSAVEIKVRLAPIIDSKYDPAYALLKPLLGQALTALPVNVKLDEVFDTFSSIATTSKNETTLLYTATIPVPQNIIEARQIEKSLSKPPIRNNEIFAISASGSKEVFDQNVIARAKDFINGVSSFVSGKDVLAKPTASVKAMIGLRFTKDYTQPLPENLINELKTLSEAADQAFTADALNVVALKAIDVIKTIEAVSKAKSFDGRAEFHLRSVVELSRIWANYRKSVSDGGDAIKSAQWRSTFKTWSGRQNMLGANNYTQAYAVSELYPQGIVAKIFVPYSLTDDMTLESLQRQTAMHQTLAELADYTAADKSQ